ncbi:putative WD40/YVTN repeat-like-containing domain superfamily [Helianthus anomalus]
MGENCKKYGVQLYEGEDSGNRPNYVIFAGGGGESRCGIPNALVISLCDSASNSLSDQPVEKLETGDDLPYKMGVHPGGEGVICSLPKSCRWFEWDTITSDDTIELRVFKWPSMALILDAPKAHTSVKNLDFRLTLVSSSGFRFLFLLILSDVYWCFICLRPDGKYFVSVGSGPGRVWDISLSIAKASLSKENDEVFGICKFSLNGESDPFLSVTAMRANRGGSIVKWNTTWKRISSKHVVWDPISAFNVSYDGKLLAM